METTNYFNYPKIDLTPFLYSKINNIEQCKKGFEYIVIQIENIGKIINWIASEQSITLTVFRESEVINPAFNEARKDITACYEGISRVKTTVEDFLTNNVIIRNNQKIVNEPDDCNTLSDTVNNQTERVELIINQLKKAEDKKNRINKNKVSLLSPLLNSSIEVYYNAVKCYNDLLDKYRKIVV